MYTLVPKKFFACKNVLLFFSYPNAYDDVNMLCLTINYAPNFEKVGGHIGFGLSVCMYVRMYVFMFEISS